MNRIIYLARVLPDIDHYFPGLVDFHKMALIVNFIRIKHKTRVLIWKYFFFFCQNTFIFSRLRCILFCQRQFRKLKHSYLHPNWPMQICKTVFNFKWSWSKFKSIAKNRIFLLFWLVLSRSFNVKVIKLLFRRMEWANINFPNTLRWDITQARNISVSISRERTGRGLQPGKPRVRVTFGNCGHYWPRWRLNFLRNFAIIEKGSFVVESPYLLWNWFEKLFDVLFSGNYWIECYRW